MRAVLAPLLPPIQPIRKTESSSFLTTSAELWKWLIGRRARLSFTGNSQFGSRWEFQCGAQLGLDKGQEQRQSSKDFEARGLESIRV